MKERLKIPTPKPLRGKPRREVGAVTKEHPKGDPWIPKEYWDLCDVFTEKSSEVLPPYCLTDHRNLTGG